MLPLILIGGVAAAALFSGCSRSESDSHSTPSNPQKTENHPAPDSQTPVSPNSKKGYPYRDSVVLRDANKEYLNLCEVLFNTRQIEACDAIKASAARKESATDQAGLNAYYQGIVGKRDSFTFEFADKRAPWSGLLHNLEGHKLYLSGHGGCRKKDFDENACIKIHDGKEIPSKFDFEDDYYNLLGAFFFLQANRASIREQKASCILVAATLGSEKEPFCEFYFSHNLVLTPIAESLRHVTVKKQELGESMCDPSVSPK